MTTPLDNRIAFAGAFQPYVRPVVERLGKLLRGSATDDLHQFLIAEAAKYGSFAIYALWTQRRDRAGYSEFVRDLQGGELANSFPVLHRILQEQIATQERVLGLMLERHASKYSSHIVGLRLGLGDPHNGGHRVAAISRDGVPPIIYKPRSVAVEAVFYQLLEAEGIPAEPLPEVDDHGDYGWVGYVDRGQCYRPSDYWFRTGRFVRVAQLAGLTDLHHSNIIGRADVALPIDLECMMQPDMRPASEQTFGGRLMHDSVMGTGLIPSTYRGHGRFAVDWTGLVGHGDRSDGAEGWRWDGLGTDDLTLARSTRRTPQAINRPLDDDGKMVDVDVTALVAGYDHQAQRMPTTDQVLSLSDLSCRYIVRATAAYASRIAAAREPERLSDEGAFDEALVALPDLPDDFAKALGKTNVGLLVESERTALRRLDIPLVLCEGHDLVLEDGSRLPDVANASGQERLERRVAASALGNRRADRELIALHMEQVTGTAMVRHESAGEDPDDAFAYAVGLGHAILQEAIESPLGQLSWFEPVPAGPGGRLDGSFGRTDLYLGSSGIAVFFAALYQATADSKWRQAAQRCFLTLDTGEEGTPWMESGWAGELWAAHAVGTAIGDDLLCSRAIFGLAVRLDTRAAIEPTVLDVVGGWAGVLNCCASVCAASRDEALQRRLAKLAHEFVAAVDAADLIEHRQRPLARLSVAHGSIGISGAVYLAGTVLEDDSLVTWAANRIAVEEDRVARRGGIGAKIDRSARGDRPATNWCWGTAGYLLARAGQVPCEVDPAHIDTSLGTLGPDGTQRRHLCCGMAGQLEAVTVLQRHGSSDVASKAADIGADLARSLCRGDGFYWPKISTSPGSLFRGRAGVGLALLRHLGVASVASPVAMHTREPAPI